jgi:hypothetical protein
MRIGWRVLWSGIRISTEILRKFTLKNSRLQNPLFLNISLIEWGAQNNADIYIYMNLGLELDTQFRALQRIAERQVRFLWWRLNKCVKFTFQISRVPKIILKVQGKRANHPWSGGSNGLPNLLFCFIFSFWFATITAIVRNRRPRNE